MQSAFESGEFKAHKIMALNTSSPIYLTDAPYSIVVGANTYQPIKGRVKWPDLETTLENKKGSITVELPNTDRAFDAITVAEGYTDKWLSIGEVYWDKANTLLGYIELWAGAQTKIETTETTAKITAASYHSIFEVTRAIRTTEESHSRMFTSGKGDDRTFWWAPTARQFKVKG